MPDTDRYGFPTKVCSRCGGTGRYSYNPIDGDRCYGCNGTKVQYGRKVAAIVTEFREAQKRLHRPSAKDLAVGDRVSFDHGRGATFRIVTAVDDTGETCGYSHDYGVCKEEHPDAHWADYADLPCYRVTATRLVVTFDDGTEERVNGNTTARRKGHVDPTPYVERATR